MHEVYEFLKQCGVYYLATVEGDQPRVRPFGTVDSMRADSTFKLERKSLWPTR